MLYPKVDFEDFKLFPISVPGTNALNGSSIPAQYRVPRKNATLTITDFKETMNVIKLLSAIMSRTFFFLQNDTKMNYFDEGVLILEPFF